MKGVDSRESGNYEAFTRGRREHGSYGSGGGGSAKGRSVEMRDA
jgi:hypothetical protein